MCDMNEKKNRIFSVIKVGAMVWGDQNQEGKTHCVFKITHILIIPTKCKMFIHCVYLLYFSYMLRHYIHYHQGERLCPLFKTMFCYVAFNCGFYSSYVLNYKRYNGIYTGVAIL